MSSTEQNRTEWNGWTFEMVQWLHNNVKQYFFVVTNRGFVTSRINQRLDVISSTLHEPPQPMISLNNWLSLKK